MRHEPERITIERDSVVIEWDDGVSTSISGQRLRSACPCAECREHRAAAISPIRLADQSAIVDGSLVGGYALRFTFGDGHGDGIYPYPQLRHLGDQEA